MTNKIEDKILKELEEVQAAARKTIDDFKKNRNLLLGIIPTFRFLDDNTGNRNPVPETYRTTPSMNQLAQWDPGFFEKSPKILLRDSAPLPQDLTKADPYGPGALVEYQGPK
ncbi:MAG: hypothetical protein EPN84_10560 [Legionella sp.]|nr:MAG: hypothetical protein EPN84_10560 [Legionella sp.]